MPRVNDHIRQVVVYLYPSRKDAENATNLGGTGFLVSMRVERSDWRGSHTYVVTNRHVIEEHDARFIRVNWRDRSKNHAIVEGKWLYHEKSGKPDQRGDDLAACEFYQSIADYEFLTVQFREFVTRKIVKDLDIGVGDDLFMVGRFANHSGTKRNLPTVRFGAIAMMPEEPIIDSGYEQETFLAEIHTVPGYSGSPVFVHIPADRLKTEGVKANASDRAFATDKFLGIEWCRLKTETTRVYLNNAEFNLNLASGISGVIPAWKIAELLNCERFARSRKRIETSGLPEKHS
jgi:hypothetical protein